MHIKKYAVTTTQITIETAATSKEAAIKLVMNYELCPRSAILKVKEIK